MNDIFTRRKILILLVVLAYSVNIFFFLLSQNSLNNYGLNGVREEEKIQCVIKSANNDTTAPIITILNPDINNTLIKTVSYEFIVNITDANPPLPGNVSIEISSTSASLFNASMILGEDDIWFFFWDNLTSYPNSETYVIRITAKDSSSNENYGFSNYFNVILAYYDEEPPSLINVIFYVIAVVVIFAFKSKCFWVFIGLWFASFIR